MEGIWDHSKCWINKWWWCLESTLTSRNAVLLLPLLCLHQTQKSPPQDGIPENNSSFPFPSFLISCSHQVSQPTLGTVTPSYTSQQCIRQGSKYPLWAVLPSWGLQITASRHQPGANQPGDTHWGCKLLNCQWGCTQNSEITTHSPAVQLKHCFITSKVSKSGRSDF